SVPPVRAPVSRTRRTRRLPVSATATQDSSAVSATPLANCNPRARVSTVPSGARRNSLPVPVCSIRSERHCSTGNRLDESLKYIVPSAATAALLHTTNGAPSPERVSVRTAPEATSTVSSPRSESHTTSPSSPYNSIPSGLPPVSAIVSIRVPSPETRMILPSSSPVNTQPSASTTTSSGPLPLIGSNDTEPNRTRTTPLATTSQLRQLGTQRDERDPNDHLGTCDPLRRTCAALPQARTASTRSAAPTAMSEHTPSDVPARSRRPVHVPPSRRRSAAACCRIAHSSQFRCSRAAGS